MISYIIPTMWKSDLIYKTIDQVKASAFGSELIIIENANTEFESDASNIRVIKPGKNIFVNPAWNLGVELANNTYVCLVNDDIAFNLNLFEKNFHQQLINSDLKKDLGIISFKSGGGFYDTINENTDTIELVHSLSSGTGFGQFMLFEKDLYEPIPDSMKIFYGDNYIYFLFHNVLQKNIMHFEGLQFIGEFSKTSKQFEDLIQSEHPYFQQAVKELQRKHK